jgi:hypothetical protein
MISRRSDHTCLPQCQISGIAVGTSLGIVAADHSSAGKRTPLYPNLCSTSGEKGGRKEQPGRTTQVQISAGTSPIQLLKDARPGLLRSWLRAQRLVPSQPGIAEG